jgi:hypothetical protein
VSQKRRAQRDALLARRHRREGALGSQGGVSLDSGGAGAGLHPPRL